MGRMLDLLRQAESKRAPSAECAKAQPEAAAADESQAEHDLSVPYIEVGGPRSEIDASPEVLAFVPPKVAAPAEEPAAAKPVDCSGCGTIALWCSWTPCAARGA